MACNKEHLIFNKCYINFQLNISIGVIVCAKLVIHWPLEVFGHCFPTYFTWEHALRNVNEAHILVPPIFDAMHSNRFSNACKTMAGSEIEPLKCALRFKPPTLVLLYKSLETGRPVRKWALCDCTIDAKSIYCWLRFFSDPGKTRKRSIPIRGLTAETRWEEEAERKLMWGCVCTSDSYWAFYILSEYNPYTHTLTAFPPTRLSSSITRDTPPTWPRYLKTRLGH